jgi:phospholipid/cholesterol/gamma-HCH transport system ATP-binding protein
MAEKTQRKGAPEIRMRDLVVGYPGRVVLSGVNSVLPAGKISVILGGSGGGKSTLLKNILGLAKPLAGRILLDGDDMFGRSDEAFRCLRQRMGVLFQNGALLGSLSLGENVALPLREHTDLEEDIIETVVRLKLNLVGLEPFIDYFPSQLSGGMRKRAGLARALALDPSILLCDEPSAGLDPITAAELDNLILDLLDTFTMTIVVVTHEMQSVFAIADHVVFLRGGEVIFEGGLEELKKSEDEYIQRFLARESGKKRDVKAAPKVEASLERQEPCDL